MKRVMLFLALGFILIATCGFTGPPGTNPNTSTSDMITTSTIHTDITATIEPATIPDMQAAYNGPHPVIMSSTWDEPSAPKYQTATRSSDTMTTLQTNKDGVMRVICYTSAPWYTYLADTAILMTKTLTGYHEATEPAPLCLRA